MGQARGDDTLILVISDHNHPNSMIGTINDDMKTVPNVPMRERVGTYEKAGFPNYPAADADGYPNPASTSAAALLLLGGGAGLLRDLPPQTRQPEPAGGRRQGQETPTSTPTTNTRTCPAPCCALRQSAGDDECQRPFRRGCHPHRDGPRQRARVHGSMDNTEVFRVMVEALGLANGD